MLNLKIMLKIEAKMHELASTWSYNLTSTLNVSFNLRVSFTHFGKSPIKTIWYLFLQSMDFEQEFDFSEQVIFL